MGFRTLTSDLLFSPSRDYIADVGEKRRQYPLTDLDTVTHTCSSIQHNKLLKSHDYSVCFIPRFSSSLCVCVFVCLFSVPMHSVLERTTTRIRRHAPSVLVIYLKA